MNRSRYYVQILLAGLAFTSFSMPTYAEHDAATGHCGKEEVSPAKFAEHKQKLLEGIDANRKCVEGASSREDLRNCRPNKDRREEWRKNHPSDTPAACSKGQPHGSPPGASEKPPR